MSFNTATCPEVQKVPKSALCARKAGFPLHNNNIIRSLPYGTLSCPWCVMDTVECVFAKTYSLLQTLCWPMGHCCGT